MKNKYYIKVLAGTLILMVIVSICLHDIFYSITNNIFLCECMSFFFSFNIIVHPMLLSNYFNEKKKELKYKENIDFEYYRECIKEYSIGALCFCYGKKVKYEDQIVATLLKFELDKKIITTDNGIEIIYKENLSPLERWRIKIVMDIVKKYASNEEYLIKAMNMHNESEFKRSDLYASKWTSKHFFLTYINILGFFIMVIILCMNSPVEVDFPLVMCGALYFLGVGVSYLLCSDRYLNKSEKGLEVQRKLIGLRKFLKEYSNIQERQITEIALWDDYIIFAILFDLKGALNDDAKKLYEKYCNLLKKICYVF